MAALYSVFFLVVKMACGHTIWPGPEFPHGPDTWRTPFPSAGLGLPPSPGDTLSYQLFFLEPHASVLPFLTSHTVEKDWYLSNIFLKVSWRGDQVLTEVVLSSGSSLCSEVQSLVKRMLLTSHLLGPRKRKFLCYSLSFFSLSFDLDVQKLLTFLLFSSEFV